jgi:phytoene dehydrogenase-like protein
MTVAFDAVIIGAGHNGLVCATITNKGASSLVNPLL